MFVCSACKLGLQGFDTLFSSRTSEDIIEVVIKFICKFAVMNSTVCKNIVEEMGDILVPIIT